MRFYVWNIFICTFLVVSSANSQNTGQLNVQQLKTEMFKINIKLSFVIDEIDQLKVSLGQQAEGRDDQLIEQLSADLNRSKAQNAELKCDIDVINEKLRELNLKNGIFEQSIANTNSQVNNRDSSEVNQLIGQLSADLKQSKQQNEATKKEIDILKKELSELSKKNVITEQAIFLAKYHEESRKEREKVFNDQLATIDKEIRKLNNSEEILEKLALLTKPSLFNRLSGQVIAEKEVDLSWVISDLKNRTQQGTFEVLSEVFALKGYPYGAQAKLRLKSGHFYISLCYKDLTGSALNFPIVPSVHYTIKGPKNMHRHYTYPFKAPVQYNDFHYERWVPASSIEGLNHLIIDIRVEGPLESRQAYSHDGRLLGTIHDYKTKRRMEMDSLVLYQLSPYFLTSPTGRRVQAYFRLNGYGDFTGKGIVVTLDFLSGPYDEALSASFPHRTTVTFFHPKDPTKNLVYSVDENIDDQTWYWMYITVTQEDIEKVLHEDTLYYQIDIVPI